jgi:hypothetical protein
MSVDIETIKLLEECPFEFDKEKKLGHMRVDWDGGRDIKPFSTWFPVSDFEKKIEQYQIPISEILNATRWVTTERIPKFSEVVTLCGGYQGHFDSKNYYFQFGNCDYWLRLIPAKDDYNLYINVFHR